MFAGETDMVKTVLEPSVYVVGRQEYDDDAVAIFLEDHGVEWETDAEIGGEALCEVAGRLCYMSFAKPRPGGNKAYLAHIKEVGHGSVLEHAVWNFVFTGISRSLTHELVRHRAGVGYSQLSQRYVDESDTEFVIPPAYEEAVAAYRHLHSHDTPLGKFPQEVFLDGKYKDDISRYYSLVDLGCCWLEAMDRASYYYKSLVENASKLWPGQPRKEIRQAARSVLPNATETRIFCTFNGRALRHFLELRCSRGADAEIRKLAMALYEAMIIEAPTLFGDYNKVSLPDGTYELVTDHKKV